jgi:hypothetical protein
MHKPTTPARETNEHDPMGARILRRAADLSSTVNDYPRKDLSTVDALVARPSPRVGPTRLITEVTGIDVASGGESPPR